MRMFVLAGVFCCLAMTAQAQNCHVPLIQTYDNQTVDGSMTVKAGTRCFIWLSSSMGPVATTTIVSPPSAGSATVSGMRITYVPRKGYTGPDRFTYSRTGQDRYARRSVKTVNVNVRVIP